MSIHPFPGKTAKRTALDDETRARLKELEKDHAKIVSDRVQGHMHAYMRDEAPGALEQNASLRGMLAALTQLSVMMQHLLITQHGYEPDDVAEWMNSNAHTARQQLIAFDQQERQQANAQQGNKEPS